MHYISTPLCSSSCTNVVLPDFWFSLAPSTTPATRRWPFRFSVLRRLRQHTPAPPTVGNRRSFRRLYAQTLPIMPVRRAFSAVWLWTRAGLRVGWSHPSGHVPHAGRAGATCGDRPAAGGRRLAMCTHKARGGPACRPFYTYLPYGRSADDACARVFMHTIIYTCVCACGVLGRYLQLMAY